MINQFWQKSRECLDRFMASSTLLDSNNLIKSIIILILGANDFIKWIIWLVVSNSHVEYQQWINQEFVSPFLTLQVASIFIFWILIFICHYYKEYKFTQNYMPYIATGFVCGVYLFNGYCIGMTNPATIAAYVNLVCLGLVLFTRNIVYSVLIPFTLAILTLIFLSAYDQIAYAPLFSEKLNHSVLNQNKFWVFSMMIIYIPIFFTSIVIFEVLLLQWRNREKLVNEISQKDPLTGVFNRRVLDETLIKLAQSSKDYFILLLDLDHFKTINDRYGHDVGDHVLRRVAKVLDINIRGQDIVGRYGGEEFMLILPAKQLHQVQTIAERCRKQIESENFTLSNGVTLHVSASFGIASSQGFSYEQVIKHADQALYIAKENGRNQVQYFET